MTASAAQRELDPTQHSRLSKLLMQQFKNKIVGQDAAVQVLIDIFEAHQAGICEPFKPVGVALFLGGTGTGKTLVCETFAEAIFGNKRACVRIDCGEMQHSHEIARLVGSPAGYLGHRETPPALEQKRLDKYHTESMKLSIVLVDECEKASDALWNLLLGILDNATLTLGTNETVDFSKTIIVMTSNIGAREMINRGIGFVDPLEEHDDARLEKIAISAARAKFSPEFLNRIQHIVTFKTLTRPQIEQVLEIELKELEFRLFAASSPLSPGLKPGETPRVPRFTLAVSPAAKRTLLSEGFSAEYGGRSLKRIIDKRIQKPLARILTSGQILAGDTVVVDDTGAGTFRFFTHGAKEITNEIQS
jgi:ATP-dependent Clp protease ATP-binding subunit ClpB